MDLRKDGTPSSCETIQASEKSPKATIPVIKEPVYAIKYSLSHKESVPPRKSYTEQGGWDLSSVFEVIIRAKESSIIETGMY